MIQIKLLSIVLLQAILFTGCSKEKPILTPDIKQFILNQYSNTLNAATDLSAVPRRINENGELVSTSIHGWTSGFFAGNLWYIYELTGDDRWKEEAVKW
ncbi:MAG: hypothetical protein K8R52_06270, partial [Bacteroidales bacterium]|nr:hypothetical protein [Bacteroidales bacterium]